MTFAVFFLAEYANMILIAMLCALLFFGGWLSPVPELAGDSIGWLFGKTGVFMLLFLWFRATFPRYRYDQIHAPRLESAVAGNDFLARGRGCCGLFQNWPMV